MQLELAHHACVRIGGSAWALAPLDAALLAWLALEGPTPRARLAALLWPGRDAAAARNSLRQRLHQLRRQVGAPLVVGGRVLALAAGVAHDLEESDHVLAGLADDLGDDLGAWLEQQRGRRRLRLRASLVEFSEMAERAKDWTDALGHAQELLALEPLSEDAHRRVIRLHYLAGDPPAALLAFDAFERRLKDEVGARPSAETRALLATIEQAHVPAALPAAGVRVPASVWRPPRLVGRAAPWQALHQAWSEARPALVTGEGGMGKTRLATAFAAAQGSAVVMSGARPGDRHLPYAAVSRLLRALPPAAFDARLAPPVRAELARLLPELGTAPPPLASDAERARLFNALTALFDGAAALVHGVVFDDLHLADDATLELLRVLLGRDGQACRWLIAARASELPPAARALVESCLPPPHACHVPLQALALNEVHELVDSLGIEGLSGARSAAALLQRSGGNPLFLLEVVKDGWANGGMALDDALPSKALVPATVHALIHRRISHLSVRAVALARCAAVAAPDFSIELASHVLARPTIELADPWAELEAAHVLAGGDFAHDIIHEAALASVPQPVARQLHAEVAAFLAARQGAPARLAHHWARAGRWPEAGRAYRAAAQEALATGRSSDSVLLFDEAAASFERAGLVDDRFDSLLSRARVMAADFFDDEGLAAVAQLEPLACGAAQALEVLEVRLAMAMSRNETRETLEAARAGLVAAHAAGRTDLELRFAIAVADTLCDSRQAGEAVTLLQSFADRARAHDDAELQWNFWFGLAIALDYADRLREAMPVWEAARAVAERCGRPDMLWKTLSSAASTLAKTGFVQRAAGQAEQACRLALAAGDDSPRLVQARVVWAHRLRDTGRYAEALALLEAARASCAEGGAAPDIAGIEHRLAQLYQQLGQPARAAQLLREERPGLAPGLLLMRLVHRADVARQLGRPALPQMRRALAVIDNPDDIYHRIASLFATRLVPADEGEAMATSLAAWASVRERWGVALAGHVRAAACALAQGAPQRALPHAEAALHLSLERQPDSFYLPEMWLVAGQVAAALRHDGAAARHWHDGVAWVRRTAASQVPDEFRSSFLHRNAVNAALLATGAAGAPA